MTTRRLVWPALLLLAALLTGCGGPPTADVTGKITCGGQAPGTDRLTISFMGSDGRPATAAIAPDGTYSLFNVAVGDRRVGFGMMRDPPNAGEFRPEDGESPEEFQKRRNDAKQQLLETEATAKPATKIALIPEKYQDPLKSGVTTTLLPGSNTFDFDIK